MDIPAAFTALAEATWRRRGAARLEFFSLAGLLVVVLAELAFGKLGMEVLEATLALKRTSRQRFSVSVNELRSDNPREALRPRSNRDGEPVASGRRRVGKLASSGCSGLSRYRHHDTSLVTTPTTQNTSPTRWMVSHQNST